ncbi:MAG TPA: hypothetical protein ENO00_15185 [Deltaproteobacteria bacterium]|nr:hypothetical protein [Deltaproteobacteria bacterium]
MEEKLRKEAIRSYIVGEEYPKAIHTEINRSKNLRNYVGSYWLTGNLGYVIYKNSFFIKVVGWFYSLLPPSNFYISIRN